MTRKQQRKRRLRLLHPGSRLKESSANGEQERQDDGHGPAPSPRRIFLPNPAGHVSSEHPPLPPPPLLYTELEVRRLPPILHHIPISTESFFSCWIKARLLLQDIASSRQRPRRPCPPLPFYCRRQVNERCLLAEAAWQLTCIAPLPILEQGAIRDYYCNASDLAQWDDANLLHLLREWIDRGFVHSFRREQLQLCLQDLTRCTFSGPLSSMFTQDEWVRSLFFTRAILMDEEIKPRRRLWKMACIPSEPAGNWGQALQTLQRSSNLQDGPQHTDDRAVRPSTSGEQQDLQESIDDIQVVFSDSEEDTRSGSRRIFRCTYQGAGATSK